MVTDCGSSASSNRGARVRFRFQGFSARRNGLPDELT